MKLLLDENLPKKLKVDFREYEIYTVAEKRWSGKKNGELLQLMLKEKFTVLITFDKNLQHQQNFSRYPITVIVLHSPNNTYNTLSTLTEKIKSKFKEGLIKGPVVIEL